MAIYTGQDGILKFNGLQQVNVRNWSVTTTVDTLEVTDLGDRKRRYIPGQENATATATIMYHDDNATLRNRLDTSIRSNAQSSPTPHKLELKWEGRDLDFEAYITSITITCTVGDVMTADVSFQMTGDYTAIDL